MSDENSSICRPPEFWRPGTLLILLSALAGMTSMAVGSDLPQPEDSNRQQSGLLILNGEHIRLPITLKPIKGGIRLEPAGRIYKYSQEADGAEHENGFAHDAEDDSFNPGRRKRKKNGQASVRFLESVGGNIDESLRFGEITVLFDGHPPVILPSATEELAFCEELLSAQPSEQRLDELFTGIPDTTWKPAMLGMDFDAGTRRWMQSRQRSIVASEASNNESVRAVQLLNRFQYPLTVLGMLLGVLTLGHMLKWTARGLDDSGDSKKAELSVRCAEVAIYFLLALSALDLTWTVLASQAGLMTELNPLAAGIVNSPEKLAGFKVIATLLACGILYFWRHRRQIQQATWWMCLVCVLLTFRGVVVDSLVQ